MWQTVTIAVVVIAIMEVIRMIQNAVQLHILQTDAKQRKAQVNQMIDDMRADNREWVYRTLKEFEEQQEGE